MVPGPGPPKSPRALRWTRRRSSIVPRRTPQSERTPPAGRSTGPTATALNHPRGRRLAQKIDHGPCWTRLGHRPEHERAHDAGVALAIVMEVLIELLLLIGGVTVAAALLPLQTTVRLRLRSACLVAGPARAA